MSRVDAYFYGLQPVAVPHPLEGKTVRRRGVETVKRGEGWWFGVFWAEPGEQYARFFNQGVTALLDALAELAPTRQQGFSRGFKALAIGGELPAVEGATQAAALGFGLAPAK